MKNSISLFLYRIVFILLLPIVFLLLLLRSRSNKAYRQRLIERMGFVPENFQQGGVVVHAASVGEVIALKPFIEKLLVSSPEEQITLTTFTPTGSAQVKKMFGDRVQHCYLPLDCYVFNWLFLAKLKPRAMVFMETELWPSIIHQANSARCKLLLINGRLSQKSVHHYQKLSWLFVPVVNCFEKILCQSEESFQNFITIGAKPSICLLSGNLKYDLAIGADVDEKQGVLRALLPNNRFVWVFASTHEGDELLALAAYKQLLVKHPQTLLVIVPRHPERFDTVAQLCKEHAFNVHRRSENSKADAQCQIWVLDSLGELMAMYSLASLVTMGGSFSNVGGHNPLEPALFKQPIIVGPRMDNFLEIAAQLSQQGGLVSLNECADIQTQLAEKVCTLIEDPDLARKYGEQAYGVVKANTGASDMSVEALQTLIAP